MRANVDGLPSVGGRHCLGLDAGKCIVTAIFFSVGNEVIRTPAENAGKQT